jgi:hypothetical protein
MPVSAPFDATWSGVIKITENKQFLLTMEAPGQIQLFLDGKLLGQGSHTVAAGADLYKGQHRLQVTVHVEGPGKVRLSANGVPLPASMYFVPPNGGQGLLGTFYSNATFSGAPVFQELDPFVGFRYHAELPFSGPLSVVWRGELDAPTTGKYVFTAEAVGEVEVLVDGQLVATSGLPKAPDDRAPELTKGLHDIEVRFANSGGSARIVLSWAPPDETPGIIPSKYLYPP